MDRLRTRRPVKSDVPKILEIAKRFEFDLPESFDSASVVVNDNDEVVAFGVIRQITEAIIVTDGSPREILKQTELLISQGTEDTKKLGQDGMHAFVTNPAFARVLKERFGFTNPVGESLLLKVNNG